MKKTEWIWFNGKLVPWAEANIHVSTHALHYGTGVFEGIRCYETSQGPAVFRLRAHIERLLNSASAYFKVPFTGEQMEAACLEVIRANHLTSCYLRPIAYLGAGNLGVGRSDNPVEVAILAFPWDTYLGDEAMREGVRICFSRWHRIALSSLPMNLKACGQYLNSYLAVTEAHRRGFNEAIMLNDSGNIAEGSGENLFLVQHGRLVTNGAESAILPGITRDSVLRIAREQGLEIEERPLHVNDLKQAQEAFFTGTAAEVTPIREIDSRLDEASQGEVFRFEVPGPVTQRLQSAYFDAVKGRAERHQDWLTRVQ